MQKSIQNVNMCNVVLLSHSYRNLPTAKNSKNITVNYSHLNHDYYTLPTHQAAPNTKHLEKEIHNSKDKS